MAIKRVKLITLRGCQSTVDFHDALEDSIVDAESVEDGKLALDAALAPRDDGNPFDVTLMDMQMPMMDSYEATGQLRQRDYNGPIIALTAHAMDGDRDKCIKTACDGYATKPIDRKKLIETIQRHFVAVESASAVAT